ncbi:MAG: DNA-binding protein WhiA, partial [Acutalibacteraceae bacterium]
PQIGYHLEFRVPYYRLSLDWQALLADHGLASRRINRKGHYVLYFKESEQIEDCLTWMGAVGSSLELMNVKLVKNIRNNVNRIANCETANIDKVVAASARQVAAVRRIADTCGIGALPEDLRELAALRLDNPEYSLRELSEELSTPLSRSGINHRLERIMAFAEKL